MISQKLQQGTIFFHFIYEIFCTDSKSVPFLISFLVFRTGTLQYCVPRIFLLAIICNLEQNVNLLLVCFRFLFYSFFLLTHSHTLTFRQLFKCSDLTLMVTSMLTYNSWPFDIFYLFITLSRCSYYYFIQYTNRKSLGKCHLRVGSGNHFPPCL